MIQQAQRLREREREREAGTKLLKSREPKPEPESEPEHEPESVVPSVVPSSMSADHRPSLGVTDSETPRLTAQAPFLRSSHASGHRCICASVQSTSTIDQCITHVRTVSDAP